MSETEIIIAMAGIATPFLLLLFDIQRKITKLVTIIGLCPNCPKMKGD